jgi:hypothetical protein
MSTPPDDDTVGYKQPPKKNQWKKGQTGNPKRKYNSAPRSTIELIDSLLSERISIVENGVSKRVSVLEAIVLQLWNKAMSGDKYAFSVFLKYKEFAAAQKKKGGFRFVFTRARRLKSGE